MTAFSRPRFEFVFLNSVMVKDVGSLINCGTVAQTSGHLKRIVSEPYVTVSILGREKSSEFLKLY